MLEKSEYVGFQIRVWITIDKWIEEIEKNELES